MYLWRRIERAADVAVKGGCDLIEGKGIQLCYQAVLRCATYPLRNVRTLECLRVKEAISDNFV